MMVWASANDWVSLGYVGATGKQVTGPDIADDVLGGLVTTQPALQEVFKQVAGE
jgi:hypothetical protein